jgi:glycosyltransferase involved in cell wall biosynthesis
MSGDPKVSATIPVLNSDRYLSEAVGRVLAQISGSRELLIVDDGSSDGTAAIAAMWGGKAGG